MCENKQERLIDRWRRDTGIKLVDEDGSEEIFTRKAPDKNDEIEEAEKVEGDK